VRRGALSDPQIPGAPGRKNSSNSCPDPIFPTGGHSGRRPRRRSIEVLTGPGAAASVCAPRLGTPRETGRGTYNIVVTEIPYLVQEVTADREDRRAAGGQAPAAGLADIRDESAEDVRLVLEPACPALSIRWC